KLAGLLTASKDLDNLIESQRSEKNKEGLGYTTISPPTAQLYLSPKKDLPWTGLDFVMKKKACFNCGDFTYLANDCRKRVKRGTSRPFLRTTAVKSQFRAPWVPTVNRNNPPVNKKFSTGSRNFPTSNRKFPTARRKFPTGEAKIHIADMGRKGKAGSSQNKIVDKGYCDSGCSRHMTGNISYLSDFEPYDGGKHNMYSIDLNNIVPHRDLTCLVAKASADECILWHKRLGKQHKATCKSELVNSVTKPLHTLHMDLFGPTSKGINREFSNARTPQQNGVAERRNRTLIEAARTMLADANLPVIFWAEVVNTACYVQNREGYFIGYSMSSRAFRVFNKRTTRVEENLHVEFLENKAIEKGSGPSWLFDIDSLTKSMNYVPVDAGTISTNLSGTKDVARQEVKKDVFSLRYIALPNWAHDALLEFSSSQPQYHCSTEVPEGSGNSNRTASTSNTPADQMETLIVETPISTVSLPVPTAYFTNSQEPSSDARLILKRVSNQVETPSLDNILLLINWFKDILGNTTYSDESNGEEADISNMETAITASQIIGPVDTLIQTRNNSKEVGEPSFIATIHQTTDPALL
nr:hypothetical protein [Tanacetum cinerariifolium]